MSLTTSDTMAEATERHAEAIMKAAGSSLRHYMKATHAEILMAVMDCYEEAYRAGINRGIDETRAAIAHASSDGKGE